MPLKLYFIAGIIGIGLVMPSAAYAILGLGNDLDISQFCKTKALRQTIVYIDDALMLEGRTEWALKIKTKLEASLMPGEPVSVVRLRTTAGRAQEMWSACWPGYTSAKRKELEKGGGVAALFSTPPLKKLKDQQNLFFDQYGKAVTDIYNDAKKPARSVSALGQRQILNSIASDEARFSRSGDLSTRIVLYSDMMENSDLGSALETDPGDEFLKTIRGMKVSLRRAMFYVFGVGETSNGGAQAGERLVEFWRQALRGMNGFIVGFGSELTMPGTVPTNLFSYDAQVEFQNERFGGTIRLLTDADGDLQDSYIMFNRLNLAPITGRFICRNDHCVLDATTVTEFLTNRTDEQVQAEGDSGNLVGRVGHLGVKGAQFHFMATEVRTEEAVSGTGFRTEKR